MHDNELNDGLTAGEIKNEAGHYTIDLVGDHVKVNVWKEENKSSEDPDICILLSIEESITFMSDLSKTVFAACRSRESKRRITKEAVS